MNYLSKISCSIFVTVIIFIVHHNRLSEFPSHIHAWAQADRYALALNFTQNGFDFLHPETYCLNPLHRINGNPIETTSGITSVDFPIHEYIVAGLMKLSKSKSILIYRLYVLFLSILFLVYLFKLCSLFFNKTTTSIFIVLFALYSPIYLYYLASPLATVCSLAIMMIGLYYYFLFKKENQPYHFYISILFITIAVLGRTSFAIYWLALFLMEVLESIQSRTFLIKKYVLFSISFLCVIGYYFYNAQLRNEYGSMFLATPTPPKKWNQIIQLLQLIIPKWKFHFLTKWHYLFMICGGFTLALSSIKNKIKYTYLDKKIILFCIISFFGAIIFSVLMLTQLIDHDYYLLDIFFIYVITLCIVCCFTFRCVITNRWQMASWIFIVLFAFLCIKDAKKIIDERIKFTSDDRQEITKQNFTNAKSLLQKLHISDSAKLLIWDAYTPNIPLILLDRKGYTVLSTSKKELIYSLQYHFDYIIIQKDFFFSDILSVFPSITQHLIKIGEDKHLLVFTYSKEIIHPTMASFFNFDSVPVCQSTIKDTLHNLGWSNLLHQNKSDFFTLDENTEYGVTYIVDKPNWLNNDTLIVLVNTSILVENVADATICVSAETSSAMVAYTSFDLKNYCDSSNTWQSISISLPFVKTNKIADKIKIYFWNKNKKSIINYKDIEVQIFAKKTLLKK